MGGPACRVRAARLRLPDPPAGPSGTSLLHRRSLPAVGGPADASTCPCRDCPCGPTLKRFGGKAQEYSPRARLRHWMG